MKILKSLIGDDPNNLRNQKSEYKLTGVDGEINKISVTELKNYSNLIKLGADIILVPQSYFGVMMADTLPTIPYILKEDVNIDPIFFNSTWQVDTKYKLMVNFTVPRTMFSTYEISKEGYFRNQLFSALGKGLDFFAINGNGVNEPKGILNNSSVNTITLGADGGLLTGDKIDEIESKSFDDCVNADSLSWLTTNKVKLDLKKKVVTGSNELVWGRNSKLMNGYSAISSKEMPDDLVKGTGDNLHSMMFGDMSEFFFILGDEIKMVTDYYSLADMDQVIITASLSMNVFNRSPKAFTVVKDIII